MKILNDCTKFCHTPSDHYTLQSSAHEPVRGAVKTSFSIKLPNSSSQVVRSDPSDALLIVELEKCTDESLESKEPISALGQSIARYLSFSSPSLT